MTKEATPNVWDRGRWAKVRAVEFDFMTRYIDEHLRRRVAPAGKTFVELGAGTGRLGHMFLAAGASKVTLVDSSEKAIALMGSLFKDEDPARYEIVRGDVLAFAPAEPFDVSFSSGLVEHFAGVDRPAIVRKHVALARESSIILHPSNRLYNRIFDRTPMARRRYGFAQTYAEAEIEEHLSGFGGPLHIEHERFHFFYTVPLLHNWELANRLCEKSFLGTRWGGLCLTTIELAPSAPPSAPR